jgi:hypothetical protein
LHRTALAMQGIVEALVLAPVHPLESRTLSRRVGSGSRMSAAATTAGRTTTTPGNPGNRGADTSALGVKRRTGELEHHHEQGQQAESSKSI